MLHDLDTVRWWFGEPDARLRAAFTGTGGLDYALATIRYEDRPIVHLEASWAEHAGFRTGYELRGERGMLVARQPSRVADRRCQSPVGPAGPAMMATPTLTRRRTGRSCALVFAAHRRGDGPLVDGARAATHARAWPRGDARSADAGDVVDWKAPV